MGDSNGGFEPSLLDFFVDFLVVAFFLVVAVVVSPSTFFLELLFLTVVVGLSLIVDMCGPQAGVERFGCEL